jgi:hypothetical protein
MSKAPLQHACTGTVAHHMYTWQAALSQPHTVAVWLSSCVHLLTRAPQLVLAGAALLLSGYRFTPSATLSRLLGRLARAPEPWRMLTSPRSTPPAHTVRGLDAPSPLATCFAG